MFKKQEGITLVALVITIIVLLILAGVSISLVVGNNGVLTQASNAVVKNEQATAKQEVEMAAADATTSYYTNWATNSSATKAAAYTDAVFANNVQGAQTLTWGYDNDTTPTVVNVTYTAKSGAPYYYAITIETGAVTELQAAGTMATTNTAIGTSN